MRNKTVYCVIAALVLTQFASAQTLFTYGQKAVTQQEFLKAFEKNPDPGNKKAALEAYLPLYINYKLKVQDALDRKLDTLAGQKAELENYRNQLVDNYINTNANTAALVEEAFDFSQKDILLGHFFVSFNAADSVSVKAAYEQARKAKAALDSKKTLADVVNQYSNDDAIKASNGVAGWITAFSIPYRYEKAVYEAPLGGVTQIFQSAGGFHIFQKIKERPALGKVKVAQILLVNADKQNAGNEDKLHKLADSLYQALQSGADFEKLVMAFSNDRTSYSEGGVLPEFGVGNYDETFEQQAFSLNKIGDISKPFKTSYGWHILKLIDKKPVPATLEMADMNGAFSEKVNASGRAESVRNEYLRKLLPKTAYKEAAVDKKAVWQFTDSVVASHPVKGLVVTQATPLFYFGKQAVTAGEWAQYVKSSRFMPGQLNKPYPLQMEEFVLARELDYLHANLQQIEPDFKNQLTEFRDANLLFEAMDRNVWTKASTDTAALRRYYNAHKEKYRWTESAEAILVTCNDGALVPEAKAAIAKDASSWKALSDKYPGKVMVDSSRFELTQLPGRENFEPAKNSFSPLIENDVDGSQTFAYVISLHPDNDVRSFYDAKGFVINDYQQILEDNWLKKLKAKYPVKVNQPNWNKLLASM